MEKKFYSINICIFYNEKVNLRKLTSDFRGNKLIYEFEFQRTCVKLKIGKTEKKTV